MCQNCGLYLKGYLGDAFLNHLCYPDDICLISLSSSAMQKLLNICQNYDTNHQLLYYGAKSFSLCFKNNVIKNKQPSFYIAHLKISIVENCKYLGITISTKNSDLDLKRQMRKICANTNLLLRKFSCCYVSVNVIYLRHIVLHYIVLLCALTALKWL